MTSSVIINSSDYRQFQRVLIRWYELHGQDELPSLDEIIPLDGYDFPKDMWEYKLGEAYTKYFPDTDNSVKVTSSNSRNSAPKAKTPKLVVKMKKLVANQNSVIKGKVKKSATKESTISSLSADLSNDDYGNVGINGDDEFNDVDDDYNSDDADGNDVDRSGLASVVLRDIGDNDGATTVKTASNHFNKFLIYLNIENSALCPYEKYSSMIPTKFIVENFGKFGDYLFSVAKIPKLNSAMGYMNKMKVFIAEDRVYDATVGAYFKSTKFKRVIQKIITLYYDKSLEDDTNVVDEAPSMLPEDLQIISQCLIKADCRRAREDRALFTTQ